MSRSLIAVGVSGCMRTRVVVIAKPTPWSLRSPSSLPFQKMVYLEPTSSIFPSPEKRVSLRAAMSMFDSLVTSAVRRSGRSGLIVLRSRRVLTFQAPKVMGTPG